MNPIQQAAASSLTLMLADNPMPAMAAVDRVKEAAADEGREFDRTECVFELFRAAAGLLEQALGPRPQQLTFDEMLRVPLRAEALSYLGSAWDAAHAIVSAVRGNYRVAAGRLDDFEAAVACVHPNLSGLGIRLTIDRMAYQGWPAFARCVDAVLAQLEEVETLQPKTQKENPTDVPL